MLVLSRHLDESIMIGDEVVITIVDISGDKVRLGIDYPQDITVHRREVYDVIQRDKMRDNFRSNVSEGKYVDAYTELLSNNLKLQKGELEHLAERLDGANELTPDRLAALSDLGSLYKPKG